MFDSITDKFQSVFSKLTGKSKLTEENIAEAVRSVRLALLDADVNYTVASKFVKQVKNKAVGEESIASVKSGDQFIEIVHKELVNLMGEEPPRLNLRSQRTHLMLCGLQGSGKTTQSAKLASYLMGKEFEKRPLLIACDLQRPAAVEQLRILGKEIDVPVFFVEGEKNPVKVAKLAMKEADLKGYDVLIFDTAGRLHIDEELMRELAQLKKTIDPHEVLFVASAISGQDAVTTALEFDQQIGITGSILTMLDSSARAGAAISILEVTKKPLKFEGVGEKIADFQPFNPASMADRILGMGDIINLVRKAKEHTDEQESKELEEKFFKAAFTYEDYLKQMAAMKKMGPLKGLMKMMPGMGNMPNLDDSEKEFSKMEAMILSMTPDERQGRVDLQPSRKRRIAKGSGTEMGDVNRMVKGFKKLKQLSKSLPALKKKFMKDGKMPNLPTMGA